MNGRSVPEWIGRTPEAPIPPRVKLRIWERDKGRCQAGCGRKLGPGDRYDFDHVVALVNGGRHAESNIRLACDWCHKQKTAGDVAEKAKVARLAKKHAGIKSRRGPPMAGSRQSPWKRKIGGGVVRRNEEHDNG